MAARKDGSVQLAFGMGKYPNRGVLDAYAGISIGEAAVDGALEPPAGARRRTARDGTDPLRGAGAAERRAVQPGAQRRAADQLRVDVHGRGAVRARAARAPPQPRRAPPRRRHRPLPPDRHRHRVGRGRRRAASSSTTRRRSPPATTRGACATWSARRWRTWRRRPGRATCRPRSSGRRSSASAPTAAATASTPTTSATASAAGSASSSKAASSTPTGAASRGPRSCRTPRSTTTPAGWPRAELDFTMADGTARPITVTAVGDTGFHLGTGLYFGFDGHWHGEWRGDLHVDGEHIADCTDPDDRPPHPPDPRQPRPRRRPGRRRRRLRQPPEHLRRPPPRDRPHRGSQLPVSELPTSVRRFRRHPATSPHRRRAMLTTSSGIWTSCAPGWSGGSAVRWGRSRGRIRGTRARR